MTRALRVLIPEDSEDDARLLVRKLSRLGYRPEHRRVDDRAGMRAALEEESWDLILCDYSMPQFTALDALRMVKERGLDIAFIIISGDVGEDIAVQAMKAGAHDYLMKDNLSRLGEAVTRELRQVKVRAAHKTEIAQVKYLKRMLNATRGINRLIVTNKDPQALLQQAADLLVEARGFENATFLRVTREGSVVPHIAGLEPSKRKAADYETARLPGLPVCMRARGEVGQPRVLNEDLPDCEDCQFRDLHAGRTRLVGQLVHAGEVFGGVVASLSLDVPTHESELELFEEMNSDVAFALHAIELTEQKRKSQMRFQRLYENMAQGVVYQDAEGRITRCNKAAEVTLGLSLTQMQGRTSMDPRWKAVREDGSDFPGQEHPAMLALRSGEPARAVMGIHNPAESQQRWISINAVPEFDTDGGSPVGVFTTIEDITQIRDAEAQLREAQDIAGLGRWELDHRDNALKWSESTYGLFEVDSESFTPSYDALLGYVHPDDREEFETAFRHSVESGTSYVLTHRMKLPDGGIKWVKEMGRTSYTEDGKPIRSVGTVQDVTDLKAAEQELRNRNAFIQTIIDHIPIGLAVNRINEGSTTYMNARFEEIYGWSAEELNSIDTFFELVYPDPEYRGRIRGMVEEDIASGDRSRMDWKGVPATGKDGVVRIIDAVTIPLFEQDLMISTVRDVTAETLREEKIRELEKQYHQAQKMESVGRLAGGVAHDFNNVLTVILGEAELARTNLIESDPLLSRLKRISEAGGRASDLTNQLLAFSRRQTLRVEPLDLNELVRSMENMLRRLIGEDVIFEVALGEKIGVVRADRGQLEQVLMNLAVNARDAMPQGGRLIIETANVDLSKEYASEHASVVPGPHVMVAVSDTGVGMDAETRAAIFEPFFTTKEKGKGTGLGLATVYGIVKQSEGSIWVYSEPGRGATFKIYLPCRNAESVSALTREEPEASPGAGQQLLVVEDEGAIRELLEEMLQQLGYRVTIAANGGEALLAIEEQGLAPDLLITDVVMPGMGGAELSDRLRRKIPDIKVLYMSGYTDNAIVHHGVLDPGKQFLEKPFNLSQLSRAVAQALRDSGGEPS